MCPSAHAPTHDGRTGASADDPPVLARRAGAEEGAAFVGASRLLLLPRHLRRAAAAAPHDRGVLPLVERVVLLLQHPLEALRARARLVADPPHQHAAGERVLVGVDDLAAERGVGVQVERRPPDVVAVLVGAVREGVARRLDVAREAEVRGARLREEARARARCAGSIAAAAAAAGGGSPDGAPSASSSTAMASSTSCTVAATTRRPLAAALSGARAAASARRRRR